MGEGGDEPDPTLRKDVYGAMFCAGNFGSFAFSTDFIDWDFVDACVGLTSARFEGKA